MCSKWLRPFRQRAFTLIELLVVILIIGILVAVAAPSFLGQTAKAQDSTIKQYLTVAYKAAKADETTSSQVWATSSAAITPPPRALLQAAIASSEPELGSTIEALTGSAADPQTSGDIAICPTSGVTFPDTPTQLSLVGASKSGNEYLLVASDAGLQITAGNCNGAAGAVTAATAPTSTVTPTIATPVEGAATPVSYNFAGSASIAYTYQWYDCTTALTSSCGTIAGATGVTYTPVSGDAGKYLSAAVTATNSAGTASDQSVPVLFSPPVSHGATVAVVPAVAVGDGTPVSITYSPAKWTGYTSFAYSWERCDAAGSNCTTISGATGPAYQTYQTAAADVGATLRGVLTVNGPHGGNQAITTATAVVTATPVANYVTDGQATGLAFDSAGNLIMADGGNFWVGALLAGGQSGGIVAGDGGEGYLGDGGPATSAELDGMGSIAVDAAGDIYIPDEADNVVRMVPAADGTYFGQAMTAGDIYTVASESGAVAAVAVDFAGNLYLGEYCQVQKLTPTGVLSTIVDNSGTCGSTVTSSPASTARIGNITGLAVDSAGDLYIVDDTNQMVYRLSSGTLSLYAGDGTAGYTGDGGRATAAELDTSGGTVAVDSTGDLYIADTRNDVVREVNTSGTISTVPGSGSVSPQAVAVSPSGHVWVGDGGPAGVSYNKVRKIG